MQSAYAYPTPSNSHFDKFGGAPSIPSLVTFALPLCLCTAPLHLLVQFHSILPNGVRYSYIFGCNKIKCMGSQLSFRTFRCFVKENVKTNAKDKIKKVLKKKDLFLVDSWDDDVAAVEMGALVIDNEVNECQDNGIESGDKEGSDTDGNEEKVWNLQGNTSIIDVKTDYEFQAYPLQFATPTKTHLNLNHEEKLLQEYKLLHPTELVDSEWIGESYESSGIESRNVTKYFQKFTDAVAADPDSCMRYDFGGKPLWYTSPVTIGPCSCGSRRVFEFQILPRLLRVLGIDDSIEGGMDFGTIMVFVCEKDCGEGWIEEVVVLQGEFTP